MSSISNFRYVEDLLLRRKVKGDGRLFYVEKDWTVLFDKDGETVELTIPKEYGSDGPSIPPILQSIIQWLGPQFEAAVVHDYLCSGFLFDGTTTHLWTSIIAADIFEAALAASDLPHWRQIAMVKAVRWFGPKWS